MKIFHTIPFFPSHHLPRNAFGGGPFTFSWLMVFFKTASNLALVSISGRRILRAMTNMYIRRRLAHPPSSKGSTITSNRLTKEPHQCVLCSAALGVKQKWSRVWTSDFGIEVPILCQALKSFFSLFKKQKLLKTSQNHDVELEIVILSKKVWIPCLLPDPQHSHHILQQADEGASPCNLCQATKKSSSFSFLEVSAAMV